MYLLSKIVIFPWQLDANGDKRSFYTKECWQDVPTNSFVFLWLSLSDWKIPRSVELATSPTCCSATNKNPLCPPTGLCAPIRLSGPPATITQTLLGNKQVTVYACHFAEGWTGGCEGESGCMFGKSSRFQRPSHLWPTFRRNRSKYI